MAQRTEDSWSQNRHKSKDDLDAERRRMLNGIEGVNGCLKMLAKDKDFQEDLKNTTVRKALKHWTGEARLPPDEAQEIFSDNYRIHSVLEKLRKVQFYSNQIGIPVPLDHLLAGESQLNFNTNKIYGDTGNDKTEKDKIAMPPPTITPGRKVALPSNKNEFSNVLRDCLVPLIKGNRAYHLEVRLAVNSDKKVKNSLSRNRIYWVWG